MATKSSLLNSLAYMGNPASQFRSDAMGAALSGGDLLARSVMPLSVADVRPDDGSANGATQAPAADTTSNIGTADLSGTAPPVTTDNHAPTVLTTSTPVVPTTIDLVNNTPADNHTTPATNAPPQVVEHVPTAPVETYQLGIQGDPHYSFDNETFTHVGAPGHTYQLVQTDNLQVNVLYMKTDWDISVIAAASIIADGHTILYSLADNTHVSVDGTVYNIGNFATHGTGSFDLGNGNSISGANGVLTVHVASADGGPPAAISINMQDTRAGDVSISGDLDAVSGIAPYLAESVTANGQTYNNRLDYLTATSGGNATSLLETDINQRFDLTGTSNGIPTSVFTQGLGGN